MLNDEATLTDKKASLFYEAKFNLGACYFKYGKFRESHAIFTKLLDLQNIGDRRLPFEGRDRRLYYNKALCEL